MMDLINLFKNHFDSNRISDDHLKVFSEDHIQRLTVNNGSGLFTVILNDMITVHKNYFGAIVNEATNVAIQKSRTSSVDNIIETFKDEISRREGAVRSIFGKDSPTYLEFFPLGITEYSKATKANVETLINRIVNVATIYVAKVGSEFVTIFTTIKTNYVSARSSQLARIGETSTDKTTTETTRNVVELQLTKDIFYIGITFPGNVSRCMDFFDQSIIRYEKNSDNDDMGQVEGIVTTIVNIVSPDSSVSSSSPLHKVLIEVITANISNSRTKIDGSYRTGKLPIGRHTLRVSKQGFVKQEISIEVNDVGFTKLNVIMVAEVVG